MIFDRTPAINQTYTWTKKSLCSIKYNPELSEIMTGNINSQSAHLDDAFNTIRSWKEQEVISDKKVYIYNLSSLSFEVYTGAIKLKLKGNDTEKPYCLCTSLPLVFTQHCKYDTSSGNVEPTIIDGRRIAMDIVNPDNLTLNQDLEIKGVSSMFGGTNDLGKRGVFWSLSNPPKREEVRAAQRRMKKHYKQLVQEVLATLYVGVHAVSFASEHKAAMEYFGYDIGSR